MKTPPDGWDDEEQNVPPELARELATIGPAEASLPLEVLRAAGADVLPPQVERAAQRYLARHGEARELIEDLDDAAALDADGEARLFERISSEARQSETSRRSSAWWQVAAALGTVAVLGSAWWITSRIQDDATPSISGQTQPGPGSTSGAGVTPAAPVAAAPTFQLPLQRPDVRISLRAMTWRGAERENPVLAALKPALDAFRAGDYAAADREFSAVSKTYPDLVEVALYQGIARLFLGDAPGATASLRQAEKISDDAFAADVTWYLAVAEERAGNVAAARARVEALCPNGKGDPRACAVLSR